MHVASKSSVFGVLVDFPQHLSPEQPLATREDGQEELACLENVLETTAPGEVVGVNVSGVTFINYSFSDACFGKLCGRLQAGEHPDRFVVLVAPPADLENRLQDISVALKNRKLAMLCLADPEDPSTQEVVGELSESLKDTLRAVKPGDTNDDLAERLNIKLTTCINRTDKLAKMRLLRKSERARESGYRQYEFSPVLLFSE
jgi:hypothetical protein